MSLPSPDSSISYFGNNSTATPYPIPFNFYVDTDIVVTVTDEDGTSTTLELTTDYVVSGGDPEAGASGSLVTVAAIPVTSTVLIERTVDITQETTFTDVGKFPSSSVDHALDKLTMICQQIYRTLASAVSDLASVQAFARRPLATDSETSAGTIDDQATSPHGVLYAIQQAAFSAGSYLMATLQQAVAAISSTTVISPASLGFVLRPEFHAAASDQGIRDAMAFADAGGGIVKIPSGTIALASALVLTDGVYLEGAGNSYDALSDGYTPGVGTILTGDGTFNGIEWNPTDNPDLTSGGNPNPVTLCLKSGGVRNLSLGNFAYGIKIGANNRSGVSNGLVENVTASGCTQWGIWIENCQGGMFRNMVCFNNAVGQRWIGSSTPAWNFGNFTVGQTLGQAPLGTNLARGVVIEARNGSALNAISVLGQQTAGGNAVIYTAACTLTAASADIAVADISKFVVGSGVTFGTTVGNVTASSVYFLYQVTPTTGSAGTIRIGTKLGAVGGDRITPSTNGTPNISCKGPCLFEIAATGGGTITNSDFQLLNAELSATASILIQSTRSCQFDIGLVNNSNPIQICLRGLDSTTILRIPQGMALNDFDSGSQHIHYSGTAPTASLGSRFGSGIVRDVANGITRLRLVGGVLDALTQADGNGFVLLPTSTRWAQGQFTNGTSFTNPANGNIVVYSGSGNGTCTLPIIDAASVGIDFIISNPSTSAGIMTVNNGTAAQTMNRKTGSTSLQLFPGEAARCTACLVGGSGFYWSGIISSDVPYVTTVAAGLPTPSALNAGKRIMVTDSNAAWTAGVGAIVATGGANVVPITSDGTNWRIG